MKSVAFSTVAPWLVFLLALSLFLVGFQDHPELVVAAIAASTLVTFLLLGHSIQIRHGALAAIGVLCLTSLATGSAAGWWIHDRLLQDYHRIAQGYEHRVVAPGTSLREAAGATFFRFPPGAIVNDQQTIGFVAGSDIHCIAPIVWVPNPPLEVEYWAVGRNCCEMRSSFNCGYAHWDIAGQKGISYAASVQMKQAVKEFQAVYHVAVSPDAHFVAFAGDPEIVRHKLWNGALCAALLASCVALPACFIAGTAMDVALGGKR